MAVPTSSAPDPRTTVVPTRDGRRLGVCAWGVPDGSPLLLLHGTPGSRFLRHAGRGYVDHHLRVITYDRPGYGVSTRVPGHAVVDAVADVEDVADHLGLDRFAVAGISGGGPRALAVAALLPHRVTRCVTVVSGAPLTADGLDVYAGMDAEMRTGWEAARAGGTALDSDCAEALAWVRDGLPGIAFDHAEDEAMLREAFTEAFRQGVDGYADDRLAEVRDWGFPVGEVRVPTRVMVARGDTSIPPSHWDWLMARLPDAELVVVDGDHFGPRAEPEMLLMAWAGGTAPRQ